MTIAVIAEEEQWTDIKKEPAKIDWQRIFSVADLPVNTVAIFILQEGLVIDFAGISIPVFINAVTCTLPEMGLPENILRINGWSGFLARPSWEIAGVVTAQVKTVLTALNKKYIIVPDEPGFIAARVLAMIINEAWFALGEGVSSKAEIDIAMKLGTNYPYGPFEWGALIGPANILHLLQKLSKTSSRYLPAPLLLQNNLS